MPIQINYNANPLLQGMMSFYGGMAPASRDAYQAAVQNRALQSQTQNQQFSRLAGFLMQQALMEQQASERSALEQKRAARDLETEDRRFSNRQKFSEWQDQRQLEMLGKIESAKLDNELIMLERAGLPPEQLEDARRDLILKKLELGKRYPGFTPRVVDVEGLPEGFQDAVFAQMTPEGAPVQLQRPQQAPQEITLEQVQKDIEQGASQRFTVPGGEAFVYPEYRDGKRNWKVQIGKTEEDAEGAPKTPAGARERVRKEQEDFRKWVEDKEKAGEFNQWFILDNKGKIPPYGDWGGQMVTDPGIKSELMKGQPGPEMAKLGGVMGFDEKMRQYVMSDFEQRPVRPPVDVLRKMYDAEINEKMNTGGSVPGVGGPVVQQPTSSTSESIQAQPASSEAAESELTALLDKYAGIPLNQWPPEDAQRGQFLYDYLNQKQ